MPRATTRITTVGRVIVSVTDQDRALDFYEGTLGFEKIADIPFGDGSRWIEVQPPGGGCTSPSAGRRRASPSAAP